MIHLVRAAWWVLGPLVALLTFIHPRTRVRWAERWSLRLPAVEPGSIVVHGASLGEGRAAEALCEALRARGHVLLRTATSDTAFGAARGHHALAAWPMDHPWVVRRWLGRVRPRLVILVESELWPTFLHEASGAVDVVRVSPRTGPGTERLMRWFPWIQLPEIDAPGVKQAAPTRAFDQVLPRPCLVAGSTRGEDAELLAAWDDFLVLAPRHLDAFDVAVLEGQRWHRRSAGPMPSGTRVLLLDTHGELASTYAQADVAFVGGSFDPAIGGHSPDEALAAGAPVVHGPELSVGTVATTPSDLRQALDAALALGRSEPVAVDLSATVQALAEYGVDHGPESVHRPWLRPLGAVLSWLSRRGGPRAGLPVVSVGNLASGGTGKTPVVREISRILVELGATPAVVSRGYGRGGGDDIRTSEDLGDELEMLSGEVLVVSSPDRVAGVARAKELGATVVVLDDGFHSRIHRDLDVLTLDHVHRDAGGLIPAGERRPGEYADADLVWGTRGQGGQVTTRLAPRDWSVAGPVFAFAGIHHAGRFLELLVRNGVDVRGWQAFPDHHRYTAEDVAQLVAQGLPLVTTEKDAVRFPGEATVLPVELEFIAGRELLVERLKAVL
ncbi:MAG: tetraacyldisaccharide 4'-kinase [Proteobacteria bacterium]|nr:tetraacyldisaccharide 4'-kinase [Pseudomonadota bacterium]